MPGKFVPRGYFAWFRTWADSERYIKPLYWKLDPDKPMDFDDVPPQAFDTESERESVAELFDRYNHPQVAGKDSASAKVGEESDEEEDQAAMTPDIDAGFAQIARQRIAVHRYVTMSGCPLSGQLRSGSSPMRNTTPSRESCFHWMKWIMRITRTSGCPFSSS